MGEVTAPWVSLLSEMYLNFRSSSMSCIIMIILQRQIKVLVNCDRLAAGAYKMVGLRKYTLPQKKHNFNFQKYVSWPWVMSTKKNGYGSNRQKIVTRSIVEITFGLKFTVLCWDLRVKATGLSYRKLCLRIRRIDVHGWPVWSLHLHSSKKGNFMKVLFLLGKSVHVFRNVHRIHAPIIPSNILGA